MSPHERSRAWWKENVVYQIYPSSFCDSNGDGFGDLNGITSKLDYLKDLGIDILWLSPIYPSPLADMGYDISNYRDIDRRYGTLDDWDNLVKGLHDRSMKLLMDLVVNHTSKEHPWFLESRSSKTSPKRNWYIWRPPKFDENGVRQPPNNWEAQFQGSVWTWDEQTQEYYLHLYLDAQPDLNWENPDVRDAVWSLMKFWLDRGCDGFRMDVINLISKVEGLPDAPVKNPHTPYQKASEFYANGPHVHEYLREMNQTVLSHYEIITVGEAPFTDDANVLAEYVLPANKELNMVFQFELVHIDAMGLERALEPRNWKLPEFTGIIKRWQTLLPEKGFWNSIFIENHDQARSVSRWANDSPLWRAKSAKMLATLQIAQSGTLYVYQGEELGMANFSADWPLEEYKDIASLNYYHKVEAERKARGSDVDMSDVMAALAKKARDHSRTPMHWDTSVHAGFTTGEPWMRVNDDYPNWNVATETADPKSVLHFWKKSLAARKANPVLIYGDFVDIAEGNEKAFAFLKRSESAEALVLLNFTAENVSLTLPEIDRFKNATLLLGNYDPIVTPFEKSTVNLRGYEGQIWVL